MSRRRRWRRIVLVEQTASGSTLEARPGRGLILWYIIVALAVLPLMQPAAIFLKSGQYGPVSFEVDPSNVYILAQQPIAAFILAVIGILIAWWSAWQLFRGRQRRSLHLAVCGIWLVFPGQLALAFAWHCFQMWSEGIGIYDQWLWLNQIILLSGGVAAASVYLLLSKRMRARFPKSTLDVATIF
jgi:hypothetical protein